MDIIPIIPAPQQGMAPESVELTAGEDATGFDLLLNKELAAGEAPAQHVNKIDVGEHYFKKETEPSNGLITESDSSPLSLIQSLKTQNPTNDLEIDVGIITINHGGDSTKLGEQLSSAVNESSPLRSDATVESKSIDTTASSQAPGILSSDTLPPISEDLLTTSLDQKHFLQDFINLSTLLSSHVQPQSGQNVQTNGNGENRTNSQVTTLHLHSTAAAFTVQSSDAVATIAIKQSTIVSDGNLPSPFNSIWGKTVRADYTITSNAGTQAKPSALTPSVQASDVASSEEISTKNPPMQNGSILVKAPRALPLSVNSARHESVSIMFEELQKLVSLNNDKVTMHLSTGDKTGSERSIGNLFTPPRVDSVDQPLTATAATKIDTAVLNKASERIAELSPQNAPTLNRSNAIETVQEQLTNNRITGMEASKEQENSSSSQQNQNSSQSNTGSQQQTVTSTAGNTPTLTEHTSNSSAFSAQFQEVGANNAGEAVKPGNLPSSPMSFVRDQEIINQIVDRFTIQSHLQTSRLSLQLNPAELGELKIEVIVKGEVLKANIYAQTHQASEVIDRNLPRLREILQGQGISVDELVVIFESETIDNFSSQYGQLFQDQNNQLKDQGSSQSSTRFDNTIEEILLSETEQESGVNLKI